MHDFHPPEPPAAPADSPADRVRLFDAMPCDDVRFRAYNATPSRVTVCTNNVVRHTGSARDSAVTTVRCESRADACRELAERFRFPRRERGDCHLRPPIPCMIPRRRSGCYPHRPRARGRGHDGPPGGRSRAHGSAANTRANPRINPTVRGAFQRNQRTFQVAETENGGGGGSRTRVRKRVAEGIYMRVRSC